MPDAPRRGAVRLGRGDVVAAFRIGAPGDGTDGSAPLRRVWAGFRGEVRIAADGTVTLDPRDDYDEPGLVLANVRGIQLGVPGWPRRLGRLAPLRPAASGRVVAVVLSADRDDGRATRIHVVELRSPPAADALAGLGRLIAAPDWPGPVRPLLAPQVWRAVVRAASPPARPVHPGRARWEDGPRTSPSTEGERR